MHGKLYTIELKWNHSSYNYEMLQLLLKLKHSFNYVFNIYIVSA